MSRFSDDGRSDPALIDAINAGDTHAFEVLYRRYRDWVISLAYRFTGDREASLDVMQETFTYFLSKVPGFRLTSRFKTFLYPVIRHTALAHRRKAGRESSSPPEVPSEPAGDAPSEAVEASREEIREMMASLPESQREVLLLRFVDGLSLEEIGQAMEIPLGTVKSRLHHGLRTLREDPRTRNFFGR